MEHGEAAPLPVRAAPESSDAGPHTVARVADRVSGVVLHLLGWLLIGAVCLNFANVLSRYALGNAILGAEEIQVFIMVWIAFVGTAVVAWRGEHLRMDVIVQRFPPRLRRLLARVESILLAGLAVFMLYQSGAFTLQMLQLGRNSDALGVPMAIPHTGPVIGFALLTLVAGLRLLRIGPVPQHVGEAEPS